MKRNIQSNIKLYIFQLLILGIVISFSACQDKDEFIPDPVTGDINDFYEEAQGDYSQAIFDATEDYVYITNTNTSVHVPANSLVNADGTTVTGEVTITFEDVMNKGESVIHNVPTVSNGSLLSNEGTVYFTFSQDGVELSIKPGVVLVLRITDNDTDQEARLYEGYDAISNRNWVHSNQTLLRDSWSFFWDGKDWIDSGYELYVTKTGWYSVSTEISVTEVFSQPMCIELPTELFDGSNSDVFLILNDYDTVIALEQDSEKMLFCAEFSNTPLGVNAKIVSISSLGESNYHFGMSNAILNVANSEIIIAPQPKSKEQILDLLGMF